VRARAQAFSRLFFVLLGTMKRGDWDPFNYGSLYDFDQVVKFPKHRKTDRLDRNLEVGVPISVPSTITSTSSSGQPNVVHVARPVSGDIGYVSEEDEAPVAAVQGANNLMALRNIVRPPEVKHKASENVNWMDNSGTSWLLLNGIAVGATSTTRIGRRIRMIGIHIQLHVYPSDYTTREGLRGVFFLVYDRQTNGAAPTMAQLLDTSITYKSQAPVNPDYTDRFTVLARRVFQSQPVFYDNANGLVAYASPQHFSEDFYKKLDLPVQYSGDGATVASIATGSLYAFTVGDYDDPYNECSLVAQLKYTE